MTADRDTVSRRPPPHPLDGLRQQPPPCRDVVEIIGLHHPVGQDEDLLQMVATRHAGATFPPVDGAAIDAKLGSQRFLRSSRIAAPVRQLHAIKRPAVRPFWLDEMLPVWQYANMASSNIFYIRVVANDDEAPNRIAELRAAIGMSQADLARQAHCDQSTIAKIENGQRGLDQAWMRRIAPILKVTPADLLPREDNPFMLSDAERDLVERLRAADQRGRDTMHTLAAALVPIANSKADDAA